MNNKYYIIDRDNFKEFEREYNRNVKPTLSKNFKSKFINIKKNNKIKQLIEKSLS